MPAISYWLKHFDLPVCPQCAQKMVFVRVQPEEPWVKLRTFRCRTCPHTETDLFKYGPQFKSR
jgi:transposase-like protein